jgi:hypothetical protein
MQRRNLLLNKITLRPLFSANTNIFDISRDTPVSDTAWRDNRCRIALQKIEMPDRLVIVVPYSEEQATRTRIAELAALGWEQSIHLVGGPDRRGAGDSARIESRRILDIADRFEADSLIVAKEICCDNRTIQARHDLDLHRPAVGLLRNKFIKRELELRGLHWRRILENRLTYWGSRRSDVDHWLLQFSNLGAYWVGEALLRQIDVIGPNEVVRAFQNPDQAMVGQSLIFTFIGGCGVFVLADTAFPIEPGRS